jgi:hypothetical protein
MNPGEMPNTGGPAMQSLTKTIATAAILAATAGIALLAAPSAHARGGGRQTFEKDYHFDKPMHGYSGHAGNYYCDYQRLPQRKCDASGQNCRIVGWTLRELCQ